MIEPTIGNRRACRNAAKSNTLPPALNEASPGIATIPQPSRILNVDAGVTRLARIPALAWWQSMLVGLGCAAVMLGVRQGLSHFYGDIAGFMLLLPAVIVAALAAGRIAGLTAVAAGLIGGWLILGVSLSGDQLVEQLARVATVNFVLVGLFAAMIASSLRRVVKALDATAQEQRDSEHRFRAIADTAPVLIWVTQEDRTRAFVNQAYVAYHGGSYEDARLGDWREMVHPDDQADVLEQSIRGEATRQPFELEARYRRADGVYRWLRSYSRPRLDQNDAVIGFVGVAFDVTEARQAGDDLKRINELLEDRVNQALMQKAKAEADLVHAQRMEAVGRLTGGVAHDFNNLLTVIIGALDIILRSPDDAAKRKKLGEAALAAARRGEGLTHQLLAFSRRQTLRPKPVDLNQQILECEPLLRQALGEGLALRLRLRRGGAPVNVDVAQFEAALLNLVVNARHAVKDGGHIGIQTQSCEVHTGDVVDLPAGQYVCVTVADNGSGMDADVMARVFEPFFTTKAVGKGTGLGLSQVYGFARQSGGAVKIRSRPGQGTQIKLYLPPLAEGVTVPETEVAATPASVSDRRLLLVEDDASVAAVALELLQETGFEVRTAETAPKALELLADETFDVMLSDIVMPGGMTGIELAQTVARDYPAMKVVLTSGYAGDDVDDALKEAPWPFLRKPYSGEELARILGGSDDTTQS